jgi:hypothetical protein
MWQSGQYLWGGDYNLKFVTKERHLIETIKAAHRVSELYRLFHVSGAIKAEIDEARTPTLEKLERKLSVRFLVLTRIS